jgi:hypothetical protein
VTNIFTAIIITIIGVSVAIVLRAYGHGVTMTAVTVTSRILRGMRHSAKAARQWKDDAYEIPLDPYYPPGMLAGEPVWRNY